MVIYIVYAHDKNTGALDKFSPIGINKNKVEMVKLACHIKKDMSSYYDKVTLRADEYKKVGSVFIEV